MNEVSTEKMNSKWNYQKTRQLLVFIISCCWLAGIVVVGLSVLFGICQYEGEAITPVSCLDFIFDILNMQEDQLLFYFDRLFIGVLFLICGVKSINLMVTGVSLFQRFLDKKYNAEHRSAAVFKLNESFGRAICIALVYIVTAQFLGGVTATEAAKTLFLIGITVFLTTGVLIHYVYEKPRGIPFVFTDTLRNVIVAILMYQLCFIWMEPAAKGLNQGLNNLILMVQFGAFEEIRDILYALYHQLCDPFLRVILAYMYVSAFSSIVGNTTYYKKSRLEESLNAVQFFKRSLILGIWLVGLYYIIESSLGTASTNAIIHYVETSFVPAILFSIAGLLSCRFVYPDEHVMPEWTNVRHWGIWTRLRPTVSLENDITLTLDALQEPSELKRSEEKEGVEQAQEADETLVKESMRESAQESGCSISLDQEPIEKHQGLKEGAQEQTEEGEKTQ